MPPVTTEFLLPIRPIAAVRIPDYAWRMATSPPPNAKPELVMAAVATASVGGLVGLTVSGVLARMSPWLSVGIVVMELSLPFLVFWLMKRVERRR